MTKFEKTIIDCILTYKKMIFFIIISCLAFYVRYSGRDFLTGDSTGCLLPWYNLIKESGSLSALSKQVGDYNVPYQFIISLFTYIPITPLYLYKGLSIFFDYMLALIISKIVMLLTDSSDKNIGLLAYAITLFIPTIVLNSSFWAQCDSIYTFFILFSLERLLKEKYHCSFLLLGIAIAFKLQTVFILPVFIIYYLTNKKYSILNLFLSLASFYAMCIPGFIFGRSLWEPIQIYLNQTSRYAKMYLNFPSFWSLISINYEVLKIFGIGLTIFILGLILYILLLKEDTKPELFMAT